MKEEFVIESPELRVACDPSEKVNRGEHKHKCDSCGTCWKHNGKELQNTCTRDEFALAHTCPNCGLEQRKKHRTPEECKLIDCVLDGPEGFFAFLRIMGGEEPECVVCDLLRQEEEEKELENA